MKTLLIILFLVLPLAAQKRGQLDSKYGPIEGNLYRIKSGIAVEATFYASGRVKTFRIIPDTSKDEDALLLADDVRKVIRELVPGRLCHRPLSYAQIEVPCPPRKSCRGTQEVWKRGATTLMVWHKKSAVYSLISLSDEVMPPPGNIQLLLGYEHVPACGIDTLGGYIKKSGGMEIHYDIGDMAGNFAMRYASSSVAEWTRTEQAQDDSVLIVLTKDNRIFATFEKDVANFTAGVSSQSDIDDFLKMVLTYKPPKRK